jgi:hypothetical protein
MIKYFLILITILFSNLLPAQSIEQVRDLENKVNQQQLTIDSLDYYLQLATIVMLKQNEKKKIWMKIAGSQFIITGGVVLSIVTGLWVPVFMGVFVIEMGIITEGKYRLNLKDLKKQRALYGRDKPDGKLGHK